MKILTCVESMENGKKFIQIFEKLPKNFEKFWEIQLDELIRKYDLFMVPDQNFEKIRFEMQFF